MHFRKISPIIWYKSIDFTLCNHTSPHPLYEVNLTSEMLAAWNKNEKKNAFRKENNKNNITMKTKHLKDHVVLKLEECREKNIWSQFICNHHRSRKCFKSLRNILSKFWGLGIFFSSIKDLENSFKFQKIFTVRFYFTKYYTINCNQPAFSSD